MTDVDNDTRKVPRIYLDQNALSMIVKGDLGGLKTSFMTGVYQLIYSDETLNETLRCSASEFQEKALDALAEMKGLRLHVNDDESATGTNTSPHQLFEEAKNRDVHADQNINAMQQFIFKIFGGRQGDSFSDVLEEQKQAFKGLMDNLNDQLPSLQEDSETNGIDQLSTLSVDAVNSSLDQLSQQMNQSIPDPECFDGPKAWQSQIGIGAEQLSGENIKPPKVIQQILERISAEGKLPEQIQNMSSFLSLFYGMPQEGIESSWETKIRGLYFFLNFIGYWPDKKRRNWDKFIGSQSDVNHAIFGAYANILISEDVRFVKKVDAIYEYLGINTKVLQIVRLKKEEGTGDKKT